MCDRPGRYLQQKQHKHTTTKLLLNTICYSPIPLTWIAILPINFYKGTMKEIHKILTLLRFIEHGAFIVLSFVLFDNNNIFTFKIYICVSFVIVFGLYYYIVVHWKSKIGFGAIQRMPRSTNRTLRQLVELNMYNDIVEMYVFGFKYSDEDWRKVMQDKNVVNGKVAGTLSAFLSCDVIDVDVIFSTIKADINVKDRHLHTVLHDAANDKYGSVECVSKLLEHGANPNVKDDDDSTPLHAVIDYSTGENRLSKLNLLLQGDADVNAKDKQGRTPLHYAAEYISIHDCIDLLLHVANVNVNEIDNEGKTPLDLAYDAETQQEKEYEVIKNDTISSLISAGAKKSAQMKNEAQQ